MAATRVMGMEMTSDRREVQHIEKGREVELKRVGGLHHLYARMAA